MLATFPLGKGKMDGTPRNSASITHMQHYTQLTYLFHQSVTSLLSRDGHIADCCETSGRGAPSFEFLHNMHNIFMFTN